MFVKDAYILKEFLPLTACLFYWWPGHLLSKFYKPVLNVPFNRKPFEAYLFLMLFTPLLRLIKNKYKILFPLILNNKYLMEPFHGGIILMGLK
jgi:hypothetical protein